MPQYPDCATPHYVENFTIPLQTKQLADIAPSKSVAQHGGFYFSCCERTAFALSSGCVFGSTLLVTLPASVLSSSVSGPTLA